MTVDEAWASPRVAIYLPTGYVHTDGKQRYPVIYTADGAAWLDLIHLPTILDNLIARGVITPVIAVMIDAAPDRSSWYFFNDAYLDYLERVIAYVDARFATIRGPRGRLHAGTSAGGRAALYAALERPELIGDVALLSASLSGPLNYYEPYVSGRKRPSEHLRVWLSAGTYEGSICADTAILARWFVSLGMVAPAMYTHEGHSFGAWRNVAGRMLVYFFPSSNDAAPLDQADDDRHEGDQQQHVNEPAKDVRGEHSE